MKSGKHLGKDIIGAAAKRDIDPLRIPFAPKDLGIDASDYGSFADWCSAADTKSGKWNKHVCLKVSARNHSGRPRQYVLLPQKQWQ